MKIKKPLALAVYCAAAALSFFGVTSHAETTSGSPGLIGAKLPVVRSRSDLFVFFNFASTGKETLKDGSVVESFKPTGDSFHHLVTLYVTTLDHGTIQSLRLVVARSFIDDPKRTIFAGDLAKSFLSNAGAGSADDDIARLAAEIDSRSMTGSGVTVLHARPIPRAPEQMSAAYLTYSGKGPAQTVSNQSGSVQVSLQNLTQDEPSLELVMAAKPR